MPPPKRRSEEREEDSVSDSGEDELEMKDLEEEKDDDYFQDLSDIGILYYSS